MELPIVFIFDIRDNKDKRNELNHFTNKSIKRATPLMQYKELPHQRLDAEGVSIRMRHPKVEA